MVRISIVMAYHNRREQFLRTLKTIRFFGDPEIIVVDDASDQRIDDLDIKLIRVEPDDKWWLNPCIAYNIGLSKVTGDVIIIQNPECLHTGNILKFCEQLKDGQMFSFAAYSLDYDLTGQLSPDMYRNLALNEPQRKQIAHHGWYNHSVFNPVGLHFCNAYTRADMERIGGFDERYAPVFARDDDEILARTRRAGIDIKIVDSPFVIHQKHERSDYVKYRVQRQNAEILYTQHTLKEDFIKPPQNKVYGVL